MKTKVYAVHDTTNALVGTFDGEVFYIHGQPTYKIEGDEIYTFGFPGEHLGYLVDDQMKTVGGSVLYSIKL